MDSNIFEKNTNNFYQDKELVCKECGKAFIFTAGEQAFYAERGFQNEPERCKECRDARKSSTRQQGESYIAVCARCGNETKVVYRPSPDRPAYCPDCFRILKEEEY